jgi:hypothetical protein
VRPDFPWFSRNALAVSAVAMLGVSALADYGSSSTGSGASSSPGGKSPITTGASLSLTGDFPASGPASRPIIATKPAWTS